jgi:tRNA pseudouridine38-40 synthase
LKEKTFPLKRRYFVKLSYNGKNYHGWQIQQNANSVQETLNDALSTILQEEIYCIGAGRTDTGVHARNFFIHFDTINLFNIDKETFLYKINSVLPNDIAIHSVHPVIDEAHARFSAISRKYQYNINLLKDPFCQDCSFFYSRPLNLVFMNQACKILFEYEDFTSFSKLHSDVKTHNCKISQAEWVENNNQLVFTITADRFLRNMVRAIVGTMLDVGLGKITLENFAQIIESKDRSNAGYSVPAQGLFLINIEYPLNLFL